MAGTSIAHTADGGARLQSVRDHLFGVGRLAAGFARHFDSEAWAEVAGRWHDLGKYAADFQEMIRGSTVDDAHLEGMPGRVDHSSAGAILAKERFGPSGLAIAAVIAGHHAGLDDVIERLEPRLREKAHRLAAALKSGEADRDGVLVADAPVPPTFLSRLRGPDQARSWELWTRMLFSALVDADSLDTERFCDSEKSQVRGSMALTISDLLPRLESYVAGLARSASGEVAHVRREVQDAARRMANEAPGLFTLSVPTGGGKTLASALFGLSHAARHGMRRLIVVPPYTSIIEQTAKVLREAVGEEVVLEHHSALDPERDTPWSLLASENWDAPIVVSTAVQFFESLFARRRTRCRKLHNIARSVIVLDEAQTLPTEYLAPVLDVLRELATNYGCSIVLSTATQPALQKREKFPVGFEGLREIAPGPEQIAQRLRRVEVRWPDDPLRPTPWSELAERVAQEPSALVIVHRKDDAKRLTTALDAVTGHSETRHLSALMCAAHRSEVLDELKRGLHAGEPVRVVSTQLVEAGVDLDFAVVFRALGGLDSLAQAAGRCNREGRLARGRLEVFVAESDPPQGVLRRGLQEARGMLAADPKLDLFAPSTFDAYFRRLLADAPSWDKHGIQSLRAGRRFRAVADAFQIIDDSFAIVVPYGDGPSLLDDLRRLGPSRERLRALQRYTVGVPKWTLDKLDEYGALEDVGGVCRALTETHARMYSNRFGLLVDGTFAADADKLVV